MAKVPETVRLVLSGHTHGGQVTLPLIGAPWARSRGGGYVYGLYRVKSTYLYDTSGLGTTVAPVRFLCPPEVAFITLRCG
jgi:predicted MPP superfamily phosphohydrolase